MRNVIITGASAGVGRACAKEFAKEGAFICLIARDPERLNSAKKEAMKYGAAGVETFSVDVSKYEELEKAVNEFVKMHGKLDVWINNAMTSVFSEFKNIRPEEFRRVTDVCYHGYVWGTQLALKHMKRNGRIILIGSALSYRGIPLQSAYCGAKHAIKGFFESLRSELLHQKSDISIGMIQLPAINTPQFNWVRNKMNFNPQPVPPIYQPEVISKAVCWMAGNKKRELFVGGSVYKVIFANKFLSGVADIYLARRGYTSQKTNKKLTRTTNDNLFEAPKADFGARGEFSSSSKNQSLSLWFHKNKFKVLGCVLLFVFTLIYILRI